MKDMAYTNNPYLPRVRRDRGGLGLQGWGVRKVARRMGVAPGTISKWVKKSQVLGYHPIPTLSSKPKAHPRQLSKELVLKIYHKRVLIKRSAEVVHQELVREGVMVSLSSVKRTLDRMGLLKKRSVWKRYRVPLIRPEIKRQGDLVEIDTVHLSGGTGRRVYIFTL